MTRPKKVLRPGRRRFSDEFKDEALRQLAERRAAGESVDQIARDLDVDPTLLRVWARTRGADARRGRRDGARDGDRGEWGWDRARGIPGGRAAATAPRERAPEAGARVPKKRFFTEFRGRWSDNRPCSGHAIGIGGARWRTTRLRRCSGGGRALS